MNRAVRALALLLAMATFALTSTTAPASAKADRRPCVTRAEYNKIENGQRLGYVHKVFDTKGQILFQNPGAVTNGAREYRTCSGSGLGSTVQVQYNNYAAHGGPFRVVNVDSY